MPLSALSAADFVLKPSVRSMVRVLPSGFFDRIEHLWVELFWASNTQQQSQNRAGLEGLDRANEG